MHNSSQTGTTPAASGVPHLASVERLAELFADTGLTPSAIRAYVFRADDRRNSRGDLIPGNGLGATGAVVRRGRRVLIDVQRFAAWLTGESSQSGDATPTKILRESVAGHEVFRRRSAEGAQNGDR